MFTTTETTADSNAELSRHIIKKAKMILLLGKQRYISHMSF